MDDGLLPFPYQKISCKNQMDYYLLVKNSLFLNLFPFIEYVLGSFPISLTVLKLQKHQLHIIICLFVMKYIKIYMPCYHCNNLNKTLNFKKTFLRFFILIFTILKIVNAFRQEFLDYVNIWHSLKKHINCIMNEFFLVSCSYLTNLRETMN